MDDSYQEFFELIHGIDYSQIPTNTRLRPRPQGTQDPIDALLEKRFLDQFGLGSDAALEDFKRRLEDPVDPEPPRNCFTVESIPIARREPATTDGGDEFVKQLLREDAGFQRFRGDVALPPNPNRARTELPANILRKSRAAFSNEYDRNSLLQPANARFPEKTRLRERIQHLHEIFVSAGAGPDDLEELAQVRH